MREKSIQVARKPFNFLCLTYRLILYYVLERRWVRYSKYMKKTVKKITERVLFLFPKKLECVRVIIMYYNIYIIMYL